MFYVEKFKRVDGIEHMVSSISFSTMEKAEKYVEEQAPLEPKDQPELFCFFSINFYPY